MGEIVFRPLSDLMPLARPYAGRCPPFLIANAARMAAIEFCERTRCWRHLLDFDAASSAVDSLIPLEAVIWEIETAEANGTPLTPVQHTQVFGDRQEYGAPRYISQTNPWGVLIHPFPETGPVRLKISVFLKPRSDIAIGLRNDDPIADSLNVVPEWMIQQHSERLVDGALARVLMMEDESWYSPQRAAVHQARFDQALNRHFSANVRGQQRAPLRMPTSYM